MADRSPIIYLCEVLSTIDDDGGYRIKVKIPHEDDNKAMEDIPYCFPLLPMFVHIYPKPGEAVMVILGGLDDTQGNRYYIGPIISQDYFLSYADYYAHALTLLAGRQRTNPLPNPTKFMSTEGTLTDRNDISIRSRDNTDIILKPNEIRLRCGFKKPEKSNPLRFNDEDMAFIQMKYKKMHDKVHNTDYQSVMNIVADRINLLSTSSPLMVDEKIDKQDLVNEKTLNRIFQEGHPLVYGDELVEFLKKFIKIFLAHTHNDSRDAPGLLDSEYKTLATSLNDFLSPHIRCC